MKKSELKDFIQIYPRIKKELLKRKSMTEIKKMVEPIG